MVIGASESFLTQLINWDQQLQLLINTQWISSFGDFIFPILRNPKTWIPLYLFLLLFVLLKFKAKAIPFIIFVLLGVLFADQSSYFLKHYFERPRPCRDPALAGISRIIVEYCPKSGSFTSSHAVNHFAMGTLFYLSFKNLFKGYAWLFFLWGAVICYAQIYVGVHYPSDVLAGAILGLLIGGLLGHFFRRFFYFDKGFSVFRKKQPTFSK